MAVSNMYWMLVEDDEDGFTLRQLSTGQTLRGLVLAEVQALAPIAELASSKPTGGLTATVGMKTKVEVKKHGQAKS